MTARFDAHTGDGSTPDDGDLFIVLSIDEAEQIITAARHDGNAAAVIEALALLVDRAARTPGRRNR